MVYVQKQGQRRNEGEQRRGEGRGGNPKGHPAHTKNGVQRFVRGREQCWKRGISGGLLCEEETRIGQQNVLLFVTATTTSSLNKQGISNERLEHHYFDR